MATGCWETFVWVSAGARVSWPPAYEHWNRLVYCETINITLACSLMAIVVAGSWSKIMVGCTYLSFWARIQQNGRHQSAWMHAHPLSDTAQGNVQCEIIRRASNRWGQGKDRKMEISRPLICLRLLQMASPVSRASTSEMNQVIGRCESHCHVFWTRYNGSRKPQTCKCLKRRRLFA